MTCTIYSAGGGFFGPASSSHLLYALFVLGFFRHNISDSTFSFSLLVLNCPSRLIFFIKIATLRAYLGDVSIGIVLPPRLSMCPFFSLETFSTLTARFVLLVHSLSARLAGRDGAGKCSTGAGLALDQNSAGLVCNSQKTSKSVTLQSNTASNVKNISYSICRAESCDQNKIKIKKIESLSSLQ